MSELKCPSCDILLVGKEIVDGRECYKCTICGAYYEDFRGVHCLKCKSTDFNWAGTGPSVLKCNKCGALFLRNEPEFKKADSFEKQVNPFGDF